jgi:quinol monooxygenase YgiN
MYARSTTVRGDPMAMEDAIAYVRGKVRPAVQQMDGCVGLSMLCDGQSGEYIVTTAWTDADAMHRSADGVTAMRARAAEIMGGPAEIEEWEIALMHRKHGTHNGACARVIRTDADPGRLDPMVDAFRMSLIPRMEDLPGFCNVSMMMDRGSGRCATTVTYDSRPSMQEAEGPGTALREEFTERMGMTVDRVAAYDLAVADLRVPETV